MGNRASTIIISEQRYNLGDYSFICLSTGYPIFELGSSCTLEFFQDTNMQPVAQFNLMEMDNRDDIVSIVNKYLKVHPEKMVHFDGCVFTWMDRRG